MDCLNSVLEAVNVNETRIPPDRVLPGRFLAVPSLSSAQLKDRRRNHPRAAGIEPVMSKRQLCRRVHQSLQCG